VIGDWLITARILHFVYLYFIMIYRKCTDLDVYKHCPQGLQNPNRFLPKVIKWIHQIPQQNQTP